MNKYTDNTAQYKCDNQLYISYYIKKNAKKTKPPNI